MNKKTIEIIRRRGKSVKRFEVEVEYKRPPVFKSSRRNFVPCMKPVFPGISGFHFGPENLTFTV